MNNVVIKGWANIGLNNQEFLLSSQGRNKQEHFYIINLVFNNSFKHCKTGLPSSTEMSEVEKKFKSAKIIFSIALIFSLAHITLWDLEIFLSLPKWRVMNAAVRTDILPRKRMKGTSWTCFFILKKYTGELIAVHERSQKYSAFISCQLALFLSVSI